MQYGTAEFRRAMPHSSGMFKLISTMRRGSASGIPAAYARYATVTWDAGSARRPIVIALAIAVVAVVYEADRITYLVETDAGQASLVFDGRRRRWFVDALDEAA